MRYFTIYTWIAVIVIYIVVLAPNDGETHRRKIYLAKKLAALLFLSGKKKLIFTLPLPLPLPIPILRQKQPVIYKEKVPVPVYEEPIPWPEHSFHHEQYALPEHSFGHHEPW